MCCMIQNSGLNKIHMHVIHKLMMMSLFVVGGRHRSMWMSEPGGDSLCKEYLLILLIQENVE